MKKKTTPKALKRLRALLVHVKSKILGRPSMTKREFLKKISQLKMERKNGLG